MKLCQKLVVAVGILFSASSYGDTWASNKYTFQLKTNPLWLLARELGGEVDLILHPKIAIGIGGEYGMGARNYLPNKSSEYQAEIFVGDLLNPFSVFANLTYFAKGVGESSFYLSAIVVQQRVVTLGRIEETPLPKSDEKVIAPIVIDSLQLVNYDETFVAPLLGYRWVWDSGLNFNIAVGPKKVIKHNVPTLVTVNGAPADISTPYVSPYTGEFSLGYQF
jgi:hypothetical protein